MQESQPRFPVIAFDADDTLWRNEDIFMSAQGEFMALLAQYHDQEFIRSHLGDVQIRNLKHFGYGIKGFTLSMIETAIELTEGRVTGQQIHSIIELARRMLAAPIELLPNIKSVLKTLQKEHTLMIITKGDLLDQESKVARSGLAKYFDIIEVTSDKNPAAYNSILSKHKISHDQFLMVGNSLKSDVLPVFDIGAQAIHVPYHTTWAHEEVSAMTLEKYPQLVTLESISLLPEWLSQHK
ncbi:HAD family hydrolase [Marinomonas pollencensis]|uniref:Putative hydrolase of the HAD superfamily n=1 Tax=Marinomonas pollencensis TaxID=491954 RepID=A0A3E0DVL7_9GAMM|nr:HAD family hydrolase [Marinomonas pollencensis]REG85689.1 putative hydrolase of the HAD superfamily [Marinomonas pollencensis]